MLPSRLRAALQFENLPKDPSNVAVRAGKGLKWADIRVLYRDSVIVTPAQLTHHRSAVIKGELRAMLHDLRISMGCAVNSWFHPRCSRCMQETRRSTQCSERWERWESDYSYYTAVIGVPSRARPSAAGAMG